MNIQKTIDRKMIKQKQLTVRMNSKLYDLAQQKCLEEFGISLSALIKVFLRSFITQAGVGFYIGDEDLCKLFAKYLTKNRLRKGRRGGTHLVGPYLKDLYDLSF